MLCVVASQDRFLSENIGRLIDETGMRRIRTHVLERVLNELKKPGRLAVIDLAWEEVQQPGVLKQLKNIAAISGNIVAVIAPNQDDDLKKLAKAARVDELFIRFDLETRFRQFLRDASLAEIRS